MRLSRAPQARVETHGTRAALSDNQHIYAGKMVPPPRFPAWADRRRRRYFRPTALPPGIFPPPWFEKLLP